MRFRVLAAVAVAAVLTIGLSHGHTRADTPTVRIAVLKFGTVNWLMETVKTQGLDRAQGFELDVVPLASGAATRVAFQAGDADMLVVDWVWAMRQRTRGLDLRFSPYSSALGALVSGSVIDLCDMAGKTVGVVGGELDKSWLILQALADRDCGIDLATETDALFGAPPLMSRQLQDGAVDAVSTYWHFVAKLEAGGMRPVMRVRDALDSLGIAPAPPMIGFVWDTARTEADRARAFLAAIREAGEVLATDDAAWDALRPLMRAGSNAEFEALRQAYRTGIPAPWTEAQTDSAGKLYELLATRAGAAFSDQAGPFDPAVFQGP
ncbi:MAG: ABC transporter substrate-binding protein [Pseudomonadota bacterium]